MKRKILLYVILLLIIIFGFHFYKLNKIETIAYQSLSEFEKDDVIKNKVKIKRISILPSNATIKDKKYSNERLYSVSFKTKYSQEDYVYFVDGKKKKVVGLIISK